MLPVVLGAAASSQAEAAWTAKYMPKHCQRFLESVARGEMNDRDEGIFYQQTEKLKKGIFTEEDRARIQSWFDDPEKSISPDLPTWVFHAYLKARIRDFPEDWQREIRMRMEATKHHEIFRLFPYFMVGNKTGNSNYETRKKQINIYAHPSVQESLFVYTILVHELEHAIHGVIIEALFGHTPRAPSRRSKVHAVPLLGVLAYQLTEGLNVEKWRYLSEQGAIAAEWTYGSLFPESYRREAWNKLPIGRAHMDGAGLKLFRKFSSDLSLPLDQYLEETAASRNYNFFWMGTHRFMQAGIQCLLIAYFNHYLLSPYAWSLIERFGN